MDATFISFIFQQHFPFIRIRSIVVFHATLFKIFHAENSMEVKIIFNFPRFFMQQFFNRNF